MSNQVSRHLSTLSAEIAATRTELERLHDRLETQRSAMEESRLRMLIAETPLADRELHAAAAGYLRVEREVREVEGALRRLWTEQERLSARVSGA